MSMTNDEKKIITFINVLANRIPKKTWNDERHHIVNLKTNEDHGTLKEYFVTQMKELFDLYIKFEEE